MKKRVLLDRDGTLVYYSNCAGYTWKPDKAYIPNYVPRKLAELDKKYDQILIISQQKVSKSEIKKQKKWTEETFGVYSSKIKVEIVSDKLLYIPDKKFNNEFVVGDQFVDYRFAKRLNTKFYSPYAFFPCPIWVDIVIGFEFDEFVEKRREFYPWHNVFRYHDELIDTNLLSVSPVIFWLSGEETKKQIQKLAKWIEYKRKKLINIMFVGRFSDEKYSQIEKFKYLKLDFWASET